MASNTTRSPTVREFESNLLGSAIPAAAASSRAAVRTGLRASIIAAATPRKTGWHGCGPLGGGNTERETAPAGRRRCCSLCRTSSGLASIPPTDFQGNTDPPPKYSRVPSPPSRTLVGKTSFLEGVPSNMYTFSCLGDECVKSGRSPSIFKPKYFADLLGFAVGPTQCSNPLHSLSPDSYGG